MMYLVVCPQCRNHMKYDTKDTLLAKKVKRCVYCGRSFSVRQNLLQTLPK